MIARIFSIEILISVAFWAVAASALGAILAMTHFYRKLKILIKLWFILESKIKVSTDSSTNGRDPHDGPESNVEAIATVEKEDVRKIRDITGVQALLTMLRFIAALTASIALPYSVAIEQGYLDGTDTSFSVANSEVPIYIALASVITAIASTFLFLVVEYHIRYNLPPMLGPFVCECFHDEIQTMYNKFSANTNSNSKKEKDEADHETYEYIAREFLHEYRFDTVFAADRFGMILQYIQGGMETCAGD